MGFDSLTAGVLCIVLLATLTQSTFGFGNALMAMPLLTLLIGIRLATPLVALVSTTVAYGVILKDWRDLRYTGDWLLYASSIAGIPIGFAWLTQAPEALVKSLLAVLVIAFVLFRLFAAWFTSADLSVEHQSAPTRLKNWSWLFGFGAGVLGGAYNTYGPPVVVYGTLCRWQPAEFRTKMQAFFLPTGTAILLGHWYQQSWNATVFGYYLLSLPLILCAVLAGRRINQAFSTARYHTILCLILLVLGIALLLNVAIDMSGL